MNKPLYAFVVVLMFAMLLAACGCPGHSRSGSCDCPAASD